MRDAPVGGPSCFRVHVNGIRVAVLEANLSTGVALGPGPHRLAVNGRVSLASDTVEHFEVAARGLVLHRLHVPFIGRPTRERVVDVGAAQKRLVKLKAVAPAAAMLPSLLNAPSARTAPSSTGP